MSLPVFPVFALKVESPYVIAGGGGGNVKYGKKNGIVIYDLTTCKGHAFFETTDVVDSLTTWRCEDVLMIAACSLENLYVVRYANGEPEMVAKFLQRCTRVYYDEVLFAICKECIVVGPYDAFPATIPEQPGPYQEDYTYTLSRTGNSCSLVSPSGSVPMTWHSLFFVDNKIHKVVHSKGRYSFVFYEKRYVFDEEISSIAYMQSTETLVFFIRDESTVYMINKRNVNKIYVPKITCMSVEPEGVFVGNGDGRIFAVNKGLKEITKYRLPITSVAKKGKHVYFSSFDGCIDRRPIRDRRWFWIVAFIIILIVVALKMAFYD